ncbi:MAG: glycogen/starch/alpha-glucan phosphorylase [Pseudomonadota bacterium]|nr:glycogen/starch/alpha-glucan phosphorylase [Pseudomonadota bacterium]
MRKPSPPLPPVRQFPRVTDDVRPGIDAESIRRDFVSKLYHQQARFPEIATTNDCYLALAHVVRDRLLDRWVRSAKGYFEQESRTVVYLSAEYLLGPQLGNTLLNLGITAEVRDAMSQLGLDLDALMAHEEEPGLGNGGLGRLAACFMDSLATLDVPAIGYGIRYEFGIFDQAIRDGWQVESADKWLRLGNPWEIPRPEAGYDVGFGGVTEGGVDEVGRYRVRWQPARVVRGTPYDTPVLGFGTENANLLRLWQATACDAFDFQAFNAGEYIGAVLDKVKSETITKVLYPNDDSLAGKELRLEQQYFFVSCSLQDMLRLHLQRSNAPLSRFPEKYAVQLNDTHPAIAVPELMRLLVDVHDLDWDAAWDITRRTFNYTNHTLLPEALEKWSHGLFGRLLPRHLEIVGEINRRFLDEVRERFPGDDDRVRRMSIIDETGGRSIRMAHLATVGSGRVNGVAALHSRLLRETVMRDFAEMYPERFCNVTNGVTPRRFMALSNPRLSALITDAIGGGWERDLDRLRGLEPMAEDAAFREAWDDVKWANKAQLASQLHDAYGFAMDPSTLFDVQVKRIHEYKRQHLTLLHVATLYDRLRSGARDIVPRTFIFGGKAAPGYYLARLIIRAIHGLAETLQRDPVSRDVLRVVFVPDFNVKVGERVYPAADLSEQVSTAGLEASGTGNMKFSLNGALTIGTLDGANVEIREAVGAENFFLFGMTVEEVAAWKTSPRETLSRDPELQRALQLIAECTPTEPDVLKPLLDTLFGQDRFLVLADYRSYITSQEAVSAAWKDRAGWTRACILNVARMGGFSSDRSIRDYCRDVWKVRAAPTASATRPR